MNATPSYSVENSLRFSWASMTGSLDSGRVDVLQRNLCGHEVLDAGCGGGAFVEFLSRQGFHVTGLDYHAMFLDVARARADARGTYVEGDITALPFPDQTFDCTYCFDVLEHVDDLKALSELIRVTRKRVILAVPGTDQDAIPGGVTFHHYRDHTHLRTYTEESLQTLFAAVGQSRFTIRPELPVDLQRIALEQLRDDRTANPVKTLARRTYHRFLRFLLRHARYRTVFTGWTVVIELEPRPAVAAA